MPLAPPAQAAQDLVVQLDGLTLPLDIDQLATWARNPAHPRGDLGVWFDLLQPGSRQDLLRLLRAPLVQDRSLGRQLIESWAGEQVLGAMGEVISGAGMPVPWQPLAAVGDSRPPGPPAARTLTRARPSQGMASPDLPNAAPPGPLPPLPTAPAQRAQGREPRIDAIVAGIAAAIPEAQVRLFGSRARGTAHADSDLDLFITVPDQWLATHDRVRVLGSLWHQWSSSQLPLDLLLYSESEICQRQQYRAAVTTQAYLEGIVLYG